MLPYLTALFVSFWQWNNQRRWRPVFWGRRLNKSSTFWGKNCTPRENPGYAPDSGWPGLRIFWPRNDMAPLLRWRRHCKYSRNIDNVFKIARFTRANARNAVPDPEFSAWRVQSIIDNLKDRYWNMGPGNEHRAQERTVGGGELNSSPPWKYYTLTPANRK